MAAVVGGLHPRVDEVKGYGDAVADASAASGCKRSPWPNGNGNPRVKPSLSLRRRAPTSPRLTAGTIPSSERVSGTSVDVGGCGTPATQDATERNSRSMPSPTDEVGAAAAKDRRLADQVQFHSDEGKENSADKKTDPPDPRRAVDCLCQKRSEPAEGDDRDR